MPEVITATGIAFVLQGTFFVLLFVFTIYSSLMLYHWFAYGASKKASMEATLLYLTVSALCFGVMAAVIFNII